MRVIGGAYRGRSLKTPRGLEVRPTSDRLRETLFNIMARQVSGSRVLDICAGSGAVGIEALSRGAVLAAFIDKSRRSCAAIEDNLDSLGITDEARIINREAISAIRHLAAADEQFDIIFFDPPYASDLYHKVMEFIGANALLAEGGTLVVEHRTKMPPDIQYGDLRAYREVKQGESSLAFFERI